MYSEEAIETFEDIAKIVMQERKRQGLTQSQLANLCNVGVRFIVDLEAGKSTCQVGKVLRVVSILGLRVEVNNR